MNFRLICTPILFFASSISIVLADDVVRDVFQKTPHSSAHAEIGLAFSANQIPLVGFGSNDSDKITNTFYEIDLILEGRFQYKRAFAEIIAASFSNATAGISVFDNDRASLEVIATSYFSTLDRNEIKGYESIENRNGDVSLGVRTSRFFSSSLVQLEVVTDVAEHNGVVGAIHVGRHKQIKNWSLAGLLGLRYYSDNAIDHILGVSKNEATELIPAYKPGAGVVASLQLGATLPLSENWTFNATAEYGKFSNAIAKSPLASGDDMYVARIGVNYILFN